MKKLIPGLILVIGLSFISMIFNRYMLSFLETLTIGILLGILVANTIGVKEVFKDGVTFSLKKILKWGIVLLGVKLNFNAVLSLGPWIILMVVVMISLGLILGNRFGKGFKMNRKLSTLIGVGSSICGASAIVAMGPVIEAEDEDVAVSVAVISLLGAIGVLIYTFMAYVLPISDVQYGLWSGSSLQGVAHALAAAGARGVKGLEIGTIVKMARVAMLAPVALILGFAFNTKNHRGKTKVKFPIYVLMFILVGFLFTLNTVYNFIPIDYTFLGFSFNLITVMKKVSSFFILMAMVAMGLNVDFKTFKAKGLRALYAGSLLFMSLSLASYILIQFIN